MFTSTPLYSFSPAFIGAFWGEATHKVFELVFCDTKLSFDLIKGYFVFPCHFDKAMGVIFVMGGYSFFLSQMRR